jgi:hypothetical protein
MIFEFLVLAAAALLAFVISASSRWLALCTTAAGGLTVAYFFMPPEYSLRVANTEDYITLLAYGTGGVLLTHVGAKRRRRRARVEDEECSSEWRPRRTCTADALREALSGWDAQLRNRDIQVRWGALPLPQVSQPHDDVVRVFSDLAATTVEMGDVDGVWIHAVELPGRQRFYWCVEKARYRRTTEAVEQGLFPDWPDSVRASTVESESERVYEVTFVRIRRELDREARPV